MNEKGKITKAYAQALFQSASANRNRIRERIEADGEGNGMLLEIMEEFLNQARMEGQKTMAYVTTAVPIPDDTAKRLLLEISRLTGKETNLKLSVDESILGGVIVRIGDRVIDGSLKARLQRIRDELLNGSLSSKDGGDLREEAV